MPYIFVEELEDGMEEADVRSVDEYNALELSLETAVGERDELQRLYDEAAGQRDDLASELDDAKTKFANAFLSTPQRAKESQRQEMRAEERPMTFQELFSERNPRNGN